MILRSIYGMLLRFDATNIRIRLAWGKFRQSVFGADTYWDVIQVMREQKVRGFLDVGMHKGLYTDIVLTKLPGVRITGFEPTPDVSAQLITKYRNTGNVRVINCALSESDGVSTFFCSRNEQTNSLLDSGKDAKIMGEMMAPEGKISVTVRRLDSVAQEIDLLPPLFAKLDVQGAEALILNGGHRTFAESVVGCLMEIQLSEIYQGQGSLIEIFSRMDKLGFSIRQVYPAMVLQGRAVQLEVLFVKQNPIDTPPL